MTPDQHTIAELQELVEHLRDKLADAESCCAAQRAWIDATFENCSVFSDPPKADCGKDYVHKSEVDKLREQLRFQVDGRIADAKERNDYISAKNDECVRLKTACEKEFADAQKWSDEVRRLREALRKIADTSQLTNVTFEVQAFTAVDIAIAALKEGQ